MGLLKKDPPQTVKDVLRQVLKWKHSYLSNPGSTSTLGTPGVDLWNIVDRFERESASTRFDREVFDDPNIGDITDKEQ